MNQDEIIEWLLQGDVAIQYQVYRDLLDTDRPDLSKRIATEGWGSQYISKRNVNKHWGVAFYYPKWISSHYSLFDLRNLCISPSLTVAKETIAIIAKENKAKDGGVNPAKTIEQSDVCVNGMFLNYASYFELDIECLKSIIDYILTQGMADGGFNCFHGRYPTVHSSMHSTLSLLEGMATYIKSGYSYRVKEIKEAEIAAREFVLMHQLFLSDRTGEIINPNFLKFPYPRRWKYDVLSALDYFQYSETLWDDRMQPAIDVLLKKRNKAGTWNAYAKYSGKVHFEMERAGKPSRWNTLRALRILKYYGIDNNTSG